jgi:energy-coupling factor transporter ATP-binding protein EcfA2
MKDLTDDQILHHLKQNTVYRNEQLSALVKLLNSIKENTVLAIDGPWGSGKTVFIKQLLLLADSSSEDYACSTLDTKSIEKLQTTQKVFYFNAWENDYIGDALGAVLIKLIDEDDDSLNVASLKRLMGVINPVAAIKQLSHDAIDLNAETDKDKLIKDFKSIIDRHAAVNDFLNKLKGDSERIIFVVDELDRCKPSFAVDVLEVMKHYFERDDTTFILTTNTKELAHTVRKYYGHNFDGYAYLNKFIDFTIGLKKVNIENYSRNVLSWSLSGNIVDGVAHDVIKYFGLEMREMNSYHSAMRLISRFLNRNNNWSEDQYPIQYIFVPLALALKIKNNDDYINFVNGKGQKILRDFILQTYSGMDFAQRLIKDRSNLTKEQSIEKAINLLDVEYQNLFKPEGRRLGSENLNDFNDAISLIGSYTTIASEEIEK